MSENSTPTGASIKTVAQAEQLRVVDLKALLKARGLSTTGRKSVLVQRLLSLPTSPVAPTTPTANMGEIQMLATPPASRCS